MKLPVLILVLFAVIAPTPQPHAHVAYLPLITVQHERLPVGLCYAEFGVTGRVCGP